MTAQPKFSRLKLSTPSSNYPKTKTVYLNTMIAARIVHILLSHLEKSGIEGHITAPDDGFQIVNDCCAPDVAYLPKSKQVELKGYNSIPPDLAVEVETNMTDRPNGGCV